MAAQSSIVTRDIEKIAAWMAVIRDQLIVNRKCKTITIND